MKIKKGDKVKVILGKDKGREAEVIQSLPKKGKVVVKGLNLFKKHLKASNGQPGSIIEKERPLAVSKVMLLCPSCQKTIRVAYQFQGDQKVRVCRRCQTTLDQPTARK
jgi:large subunit ribosomal protein L24